MFFMKSGISDKKMIEELKNRTYKVVKEIKKGWSSDKKYFIQTIDNQKLLMRVSDIELLEAREIEFEYMKKLFNFGIPMSKPLQFGICKDSQHVYTLLSWIDGEDAEIILPKLTTEEQYNLGYNAGNLLRKIHSISAPTDCEDWNIRYNRKIDNKINNYNNCNIKIPNGDKIIEYIIANRHLLEIRPQTFQHGDFHIGNLILSNNNQVYVIDFNRSDFGDPWEEFNRIPFCARKSPAFAKGRIDGYFDNNVTDDFFKLMTLYICVNTISSIPWAIPHGEKEVETMLNIANQIMLWHDNMRSAIPAWY